MGPRKVQSSELWGNQSLGDIREPREKEGLEAAGWRITTLFTSFFLASIQLMPDLGVLSEIEAGSTFFLTCHQLGGALARSLCGPGLFP